MSFIEDILPLIELKGIAENSLARVGKKREFEIPCSLFVYKIEKQWDEFSDQVCSCVFCYLLVENSVSIHK